MSIRLWFDVEKKNYTTIRNQKHRTSGLWFDVEKKNYTTIWGRRQRKPSCGLM